MPCADAVTRLLIVFGVAAWLTCAHAQALTPWLPDLSRTPGAVDPRVTQDTVATTICVAGYTETVRPHIAVTTALKRRQMVAWGLSGKTRDYEEDHLVSLEVGGAPADPKNLWPMPYAGPCGARVKDVVERALNRLVCSGQMPLAQAQREIAQDWTASYRTHVGALTCR